MLSAPSKSTIPPIAITSILLSNWAASTLFAAIELDLFGPLKDGARSAADVARQLKIDERGAGVMLDALTGLGLLEKRNDTFTLTDPAKLYLVKSSPLYLGEYLSFTRESLAKSWASLADSVRGGKPNQEVNKQETAEKFFPALAASLFPLNYATASLVADDLKLKELPKNARVLDVAAGSAVWSIPVAERHSTLTVDALDFPAVLKVARSYSEKYGVVDRYKFLSGNWRDINLDAESYDVVILGHILHSEGRSASAELLAKTYKSMKPGARLIVAEFMPNESRTGPVFPLLFAINMFLQTTEGCVFSVAELEKLLNANGFDKVSRLNLPAYKDESPVVVAVRK